MNGWANYETWNAALWIGNDEFLYNTAKACVTYREGLETPWDKLSLIHISEPTRLRCISYAVFCLKKKK